MQKEKVIRKNSDDNYTPSKKKAIKISKFEEENFNTIN